MQVEEQGQRELWPGFEVSFDDLWILDNLASDGFTVVELSIRRLRRGSGDGKTRLFEGWSTWVHRHPVLLYVPDSQGTSYEMLDSEMSESRTLNRIYGNANFFPAASQEAAWVEVSFSPGTRRRRQPPVYSVRIRPPLSVRGGAPNSERP